MTEIETMLDELRELKKLHGVQHVAKVVKGLMRDNPALYKMLNEQLALQKKDKKCSNPN